MSRARLQAPFWLNPSDRTWFPDVALAMQEPNGLLAVGGDLSPERLLVAYQRGIFPWYSQGQPVMWWSPSPRAVVFPEQIRISRSLRKTIRNRDFSLHLDSGFPEVVSQCATSRKDGLGTWITDEMKQAYIQLHDLGSAHSVEVRQAGQLVGGLYGVAIGRVFFGESMFSRMRDASKIAFVALARHLQANGFAVIDCQVASAHLFTLGAQAIPREAFIQILTEHAQVDAGRDTPAWTGFIDKDGLQATL